MIAISIPLALWFVPPPLFTGATVEIPRGSSIQSAADRLAKAGVVYGPRLVSIPLRLKGEDITAGTYKFDKPENALTVTRRLSNGKFGMPPQTVLVPEGFTNTQIANRLEKKLSETSFSRAQFLRQAAPLEGYLFPDTYQFLPNTSSHEVIKRMKQNFTKSITTLQSQINSFDHSLDEIITMASLVEREAADYETRRRIAGVLWRRLEQRMHLQVDAVFPYILGKNTYELTHEDLNVDSSYNLYKYKGLPPGPIANPGLSAIRATVNPIESETMYYLSDRNDNFYFAETLEEHNRNKRQYLDRAAE